jgi:ferredoxin-NADP reductase
MPGWTTWLTPSPGSWTAERAVAVVRRIECTVRGVTDHGECVYSVELEPSIPVPRFQPGQFMHFALDPADRDGFWPESRVFSIASPPEERDRLAITYAVKGAFTTRMEHELMAGRRVWIKLPYGEFFIDPSHDAVLFAGGTGMTAFTAFLGSLAPDHDRRVQLYYGARTADLFVFGELARERAGAVPGLTSELINEQADGRLSVDAAWPAVAPLDNPIFYLSGPPPMLEALTRQLREHDVPAERIRTDAWE